MALHHARATEAESIQEEERERSQQQQHQRANAHTKKEYRRGKGFGGVANTDVNAPMLIKIVREETGGPVGC